MHHTLSPWTVHQDGPAKIPTIESPSGPVAMLYAGESAAADARIIAAAPDLLAALWEILPIVARSIQGTTDGEPMLARARAAVAKAIGEQTP